MALPPINENGRAGKIPLPLLNTAQVESPGENDGGSGVNRVASLSSLPYDALALPLARDMFQILSGRGFKYDLSEDSDVYELERKIDYLAMDNKDTEAMPLALVLLALKVQNKEASQDYFIRVAGICLLGGRHDIYSKLVDLMYTPNDEKNIDVIKGFLQTLELPKPVEQNKIEPPISAPVISKPRPISLPPSEVTGTDRIRLLESEINFLNMSGRHNETIPLALDLLTTQIECKSANQSSVIRAAGVCNLSGRHDLYNELLKLMVNPNDEKNVHIVKAFLAPLKPVEQATLRID